MTHSKLSKTFATQNSSHAGKFWWYSIALRHWQRICTHFFLPSIKNGDDDFWIRIQLVLGFKAWLFFRYFDLWSFLRVKIRIKTQSGKQRIENKRNEPCMCAVFSSTSCLFISTIRDTQINYDCSFCYGFFRHQSIKMDEN